MSLTWNMFSSKKRYIFEDMIYRTCSCSFFYDSLFGKTNCRITVVFDSCFSCSLLPPYYHSSFFSEDYNMNLRLSAYIVLPRPYDFPFILFIWLLAIFCLSVRTFLDFVKMLTFSKYEWLDFVSRFLFIMEKKILK